MGAAGLWPLILALGLWPFAPALGADSTVPAMTAAGAITGAELVYCVQGGADRKCTADQTDIYTFSRISQDCTATSAGVITCTKTNNVAFGTLATAATPLSTANGGTGTATPALVAGGIVSLTGTWPNNTITVEPVVTYATGQFYFPAVKQMASGVAHGANVIKCHAGRVEQKLTTTNSAVRITTLFSGGNAQVAMYQDVSGRPGALIASTGNISTTTLGSNITTAWSAAKQIGPGGADGGRIIWWCSNMDNATAALSSPEGPSSHGGWQVGGPRDSLFGGSTTTITGISCTGAACNGGSSTFGTWPSTLAGTTWSALNSASLILTAFDVTSVP